MSISGVDFRPDQPVNTLEEILDRVIPGEVIRAQNVPHLEPGQRIKLAISHGCRPTAEQLEAYETDPEVFLEGCFTPPKYEEDTRLLLGYHPDRIASFWKPEEEDYFLLSVIDGDVDWKTQPVLEINGCLLRYHPVEAHPDGPQPKLDPKVKRLWESLQKERQGLLYLQLKAFYQSLECSLEELQLTEEDLLTAIPLILPDWKEQCREHIPEITFTGHSHIFQYGKPRKEAAEFLGLYYRYIVVEKDNLELGYAKAWPLNK